MWTLRRIDEWGEYHSPNLCFGKSAPAPPAAPDPTAVAAAQSASNQQTAETQAALNNVDQYTPYGNLTYSQVPGTGTTFDQAGYDAAMKSWVAAGGVGDATRAGATNNGAGNWEYQQGDGSVGSQGHWFNVATGQTSNNPASLSPESGGSISGGSSGAGAEPTVAQFTHTNGTPRWQATESLTPAGEKALQSQQSLTQSLYDLANSQTGRITQAMSTPFDMSKVPAMPTNPSGVDQKAADTIFNAQMAELTPVFKQQTQQLEDRLASQGIAPGNEAALKEEQILGDTQGATTQQASATGVTEGANLAAQNWGQEMQANQTGLQEQEYLREQPLNEAIALMGGGQVNMPQFVSTPQTAVAPTDVTGAYALSQNARDVAYQGGIARANSGNSAMAGLAGAAASAAIVF